MRIEQRSHPLHIGAGLAKQGIGAKPVRPKTVRRPARVGTRHIRIGTRHIGTGWLLLLGGRIERLAIEAR